MRDDLETVRGILEYEKLRGHYSSPQDKEERYQLVSHADNCYLTIHLASLDDPKNIGLMMNPKEIETGK